MVKSRELVLYFLAAFALFACDPKLNIKTSGSNAASTFCDPKNPECNISPNTVLSGTEDIQATSSKVSVLVESESQVQYQYEIIQGSDCTAATYSEWTDLDVAITEELGADGDYTLCVVTRDALGRVSDPVGYSWTKSALEIMLDGLPSVVSNETALNVSVSGDGAESYRYVLAQGAPCSDASDSDTWISIGTPIADLLGADGEYTLCVQGRINENAIQDGAITYTWLKDTVAPLETILSGVPEGANNFTTLDISINDPDIASYKYKLGAGAQDCSILDGYSDDIVTCIC